MTLSILWLITILLFVLVACFQSRNRLFVYDLALVIALVLLGSIYVIDKYALGLKIATVVSEVFHNMFSGIFASQHLGSKDLSVVIWATALLFMFVIVYVLLLVLFKYIIIGRNPVLPYKKKDYFTHFLISFFFVLSGFVITTFVFTFISPLTNMEQGFMAPFFNYLYGGLKI